ncbi:hypothetical protein LGM65_23475 [Burkholderia anthina]|uniref:hypothetical protein n=1 Tax=Burkholderia anthina TaxID=179879 RepID=UPI001CF490D0|nr:hypothetical protein [Burkholderia anthina]MCA8093812.1 hypothetical protein [Burkholderia anthina]
MVFVVPLVLIDLSWVASPLYAQNIVFDGKVNIYIPEYENKRVNPDGSDSVCVDVNHKKAVATICLYKNISEKIYRDNGFVKYGELSSEGRNRIPQLSEDDLVYVEGSYGTLYETGKKKIGDFIVHEAENTLCDISDTAEKRPAVCYEAALNSSKKSNAPPAIFISAIIEQPPAPGGNLGKQAMDKINSIREIIKSIKIEK